MADIFLSDSAGKHGDIRDCYDSWSLLKVIPGKEAHSQISWASSTERVWHFTVFHSNERIYNNLNFLKECSRTLERSDRSKERGRICLWREVHFLTRLKLSLNSGHSSKKCERLNNILAERQLEYNHERQRIDDAIRLLTLELDKFENTVFNVFLFMRAYQSNALQMPVDVQYTTSQELTTVKVW
jgi:hypothetical protein